MRARLAVLTLLAMSSGATAFGQYVYDSVANASTWTWGTNGSVSTGPPVNFSGSSGGSIISTTSVSGTASDYEAASTLALNSGGGTYIHFLRAGSSTVEPGSGSYISAEIVIPTSFTAPGSVTLNVNQSVSGTLTTLASTSITATNGMSFRTIAWGTNLWIFVNGVQVEAMTIPSTTGNAGYGGYGMPSGSGFSMFELGHHDTVAPGQVVAHSIYSSVFPTSASLQWQGVQDDSIGIGLFEYTIARNGTAIATSPQAEFADATVTASNSYTYTIQAVDYHGNVSTATTVTVTTPPAGAVDPRRIGIYSTGSYWGGGGEQIDTLSGNLHFSLPLVAPQGRSGWTVPVSLVYDSQNWRQDNGVNWKLGSDVGYGFGWRALIGSITPYYTGYLSGVDHYTYTDSSGAQYRLDQNNSGVWTSTQSVYVWLDTTVSPNKLHFRDGTFWVLGSTSSGLEADAGTMYPTVIEDVSGNQVIVAYDTAMGLPYENCCYVLVQTPNTSSRITAIDDVRAINESCYGMTRVTYCFNYTPNVRSAYATTTPHIQNITNTIFTAEAYSFTFSNNAAQGPPFGTDPSYNGATTSFLSQMSAVPTSYQFGYDSAGAGELTSVIFPYGGELSWTYDTFQYVGSRSLREVAGRSLAADYAHATTPWSYGISRPDAANSVVVHSAMTLVDASGVGAKTWNFFEPGGSTPAWEGGLISQFVQSASSGGTVLQTDSYTWSQDPASHPYISSKTTVISPGSSNQQSALSTQTLDQYGNVTQSVVYPYNNTATAVNTYNSTFLNSSAYTSHYIFNRLLSTTLTVNGTNKTLVTNTYDFTGGFLTTSSGGCGFGWGYGTLPTTEMDASPPIPLGSRGYLVYSATPAKTSATLYLNVGPSLQTCDTEGNYVSASSTSTTNYAAPGTITTQSYSQNVSYNSWLGITQTTGLNGEQLYMSYDSYGRPSYGMSPYGAATTYTYGGLPPLYAATQTETGPNGVTNTILDGLGRTVEVQRGNSSGMQSYVDTVYAPCACSPLGKVQKVSQPYAPGTPSGSIVWTVYSYDGLGRTLSVVQPDGASSTTYAYSGNQTTVTDPAGKWKQFTDDVLNNLLSVVEPDPCVTTNTLTTTYTYDWMNHVSGVTMTRPSMTYSGSSCSESSPSTQTRTFVYSDAGLLTSATNPENGTVYYYYNANNTLYYKHDAKGQDTVYTYDLKNRVTEIQYYPTGKSNREDTCNRVIYSYDTNPYNSSFSQYSTGRLTASQYSNCWTGDTNTDMYSYHPAGAVTAKALQVTNSGQSASLQVNYTYTSAGQVATVSYPVGYLNDDGSQPTQTYTYDSMARPTRLIDDLNQYWAYSVQYDYASRMTSFSYGTGYSDGSKATSYNVNGQVGSLAWSTVYGAAGGVQYVYSSTQNNGQITQAVDTLSGETINYQYDALKRLTSAASTPSSGSTPTAWTQTYQYDGFGNLTAKALNGTSTPIAVNTTTNHLTNAYYDNNGNMTSGAGATLTYDEANRLTEATDVSGATEFYSYAPDNKRYYRIEEGAGYSWNGIWTFYGAKGEKLGDYEYVCCDDNGNALFLTDSYNVWFAGNLVYEGGSYPALDRLGTNRLNPTYPYLTNVARFYPYGDEITSTSNDRTKFATYMRDAPTGLDYANQRYYASTYGRFNTPDPYVASARLKDPSRSWNRYAYTRGDPVNRLDPRGLDDCAQDESWCGNDPCDPSSYYYDPYDPSCDDGGDDDDGSFGETYFAPPTSFTPVTRGSGGGAGGAHPSPPTPTCSISLYERPVNVAGLSTTAVHTYIDATVTYDGVTQQDIIDGGPIAGLRASGLLLNGWSTVGATGHYASDNPSLLSNDEIGSTYTGLSACQDISQLNSEVSSYDKGTLAMYNPVPSFWVPGWNSNSFTYTLLNSVGLAFSFGNLPSWTPGWGLAVPGLTSPY